MTEPWKTGFATYEIAAKSFNGLRDCPPGTRLARKVGNAKEYQVTPPGDYALTDEPGQR